MADRCRKLGSREYTEHRMLLQVVMTSRIFEAEWNKQHFPVALFTTQTSCCVWENIRSEETTFNNLPSLVGRRDGRFLFCSPSPAEKGFRGLETWSSGVYWLRRGKIGFSGPSWCFSHPSMKGQTQITPFLIWFWNIFGVILGHSWQWLKNIYHFIVVGICTFRQFQQKSESR